MVCGDRHFHIAVYKPTQAIISPTREIESTLPSTLCVCARMHGGGGGRIILSQTLVVPITALYIAAFQTNPTPSPTSLHRALPVVIIVPVFASLIATAQLWGQADECTCWCFPHVGNVLPFSTGRDLVRGIRFFVYYMFCANCTQSYQ